MRSSVIVNYLIRCSVRRSTWRIWWVSCRLETACMGAPLPAHYVAAHAHYCTLPYKMLCEKVYLKELVSVLLAGYGLHGAPGPSSPLTVPPLRSIVHYLIRCSVRRSIWRNWWVSCRLETACMGHQAPPPRSLWSRAFAGPTAKSPHRWLFMHIIIYLYLCLVYINVYSQSINQQLKEMPCKSLFPDKYC